MDVNVRGDINTYFRAIVPIVAHFAEYRRQYAYTYVMFITEIIRGGFGHFQNKNVAFR